MGRRSQPARLEVHMYSVRIYESPRNVRPPHRGACIETVPSLEQAEARRGT